MKQFRIALLASVVTLPAHAALPVIDELADAEWVQQIKDNAEQLVHWAHQAEQMDMEIQHAFNTVHALTNVPSNMVHQLTGLISQAIQNPLGDIQFNLHSLMFGGGGGRCSGSAQMLASSQFFHASGRDPMATWMNGGADRLAGLMSCTDVMMRSTQDRLNQLPGLLDQLKDCTDVSCTTLMSGRIQAEVANINAQQQQAQLVGQQAEYYKQVEERQMMQRLRKDAEEDMQGRGGDGSDGAAVATADAPVFSSMTGG